MALPFRRSGPRALEKQVQADVVRLYQTFACTVHNLSQPRATMQTEGLPDLYVQHLKSGTTWWHECKRPGGKLSAHQAAFRDREAKCRRTVVVGGVQEAKVMLAMLGLIIQATPMEVSR